MSGASCDGKEERLPVIQQGSRWKIAVKRRQNKGNPWLWFRLFGHLKHISTSSPRYHMLLSSWIWRSDRSIALTILVLSRPAEEVERNIDSAGKKAGLKEKPFPFSSAVTRRSRRSRKKAERETRLFISCPIPVAYLRTRILGLAA